MVSLVRVVSSKGCCIDASQEVTLSEPAAVGVRRWSSWFPFLRLSVGVTGPEGTVLRSELTSCEGADLLGSGQGWAAAVFPCGMAGVRSNHEKIMSGTGGSVNSYL